VGVGNRAKNGAEVDHVACAPVSFFVGLDGALVRSTCAAQPLAKRTAT